MNRRTTIKDIARVLSLSISTVSRALSDHPDISPVTKRRVSEAAAQLGYRANLLARGFRQQHSGIVALVLPEVNDYFSPSLIAGVSASLRQSGRMLQIFLTQDRSELEAEVVQQCVDLQVEGVLLSLVSTSVGLDHLKPLVQNEVPCILIDKTAEDVQLHSVRFDGYQAGYQAVRYLVSKGHRDILAILGSCTWRLTQEREEGFRAGVAQFAGGHMSPNVIHVEQVGELELLLAKQFSLAEGRPSALFAMSDELLAHSMRYLQRMGLRIPEDVSVLGVSDGKFPMVSVPSISYVKTSGYDMGWLAGLMVSRVRTQEGGTEHVSMPVEIVEQESVALRA